MGYNEAIVNSPVVVFAGAGASAHLGYPMGDAMLDILRRAATAPDAGEELRGIWDLIEGSKGEEAISNFEEAFDRLDAVCVSACLTGKNDTKARADELRLKLREHIVEAFGKSPEPVFNLAGLIRPWSTAWRQLLGLVHPGKGQCLPLFTTNYDVVLDYLADALEEDDEAHGPLRIVSPFPIRRVKEARWEAQKIDDYQPRGDCREVFVFRLHGCVAWDAPDDSRAGYRLPVLKYVDGKVKPAQGGKALIWPSLRKTPFRDPFWTEHAYFERCLESAQVAFFVGYGFWDDAVCAAVRRALVVNKELLAYVLDPSAQPYGRLVESIKSLGIGVRDLWKRVAHIPFGFDYKTMSRLRWAIEQQEKKTSANRVARSRDLLRAAGECWLAEQKLTEDGKVAVPIGLEPSGGMGHEWQGTDGGWRVLKREDGDAWGLCLSKEECAGNVLIRADVVCSSPTNWAGIVFGWRSPDNHWAFIKQDNEVRLKHVLPGAPDESVGGPFGDCPHDQKHTLVVHVGPEGYLQCTVLDDQGQVRGLRDADYAAEGRVGLAVSEETGQNAEFTGIGAVSLE